MIVPELFRIVNIDPGSPVPRIVGVESDVRYVGFVSHPAEVILGAIGRVASTVNIVVVGGLVFPAISMRVTL
jgi:hypothetical protein